jgi:hypothetical protein
MSAQQSPATRQSAHESITDRHHRRFIRNVLVKTGLLFLLANLIFALVDPLPAIGRISLYNRLVPGRVRLPYGEFPERSYSLSLFNLEAMFASHELAGEAKVGSEFRVLLIGDSSTWGFLLRPDQTLAAHLNASRFTLPDGRQLRAYNLGYPVMSLAKDLLILERGLQYRPDLIVWLVTLESFPYDKQLYPPLLQQNPGPVRSLIQAYNLALNPDDHLLARPTFWDRTIIGRRRALADIFRLQLYGVMWAATGIDQDIPAGYTPRMEDLPADPTFHDLQPPHLQAGDLAFDILRAVAAATGETPLLIVNEPMFISQGQNSDIRYNYFYPRWAYDDYRRLLAEECATQGWQCLDLWDNVPATEFTNSAVHLTPEGSSLLADELLSAIQKIASAP